jgi:YidC/Oxa1 family membrane protein insertase
VTDSKNMILAIVLSVLVLLGWSWAANRYFPTATTQTTKVAAGKQQPLPQPQASPAPTTQKALQTRSAVLGASPRVAIRTPSLSGSISLKGAIIDDLVLLRQKETIARNSPPVRLLSPLGAPGAYVAMFGWSAQSAIGTGFDTMWTADSNQLTPGHPVTLRYDSPDGRRFTIKIAVDEGYLFTVTQQVTNASAKPVTIVPMSLISRSSQSADPSTWTNHVGPISVFGGKADYYVSWKNVDEAGNGGKEFGGVSGWLGFTDK